MMLYAEIGSVRARQAAGDAAAALWVLAWVWVGRSVHAAVNHLADPGTAMRRAGEQLAGPLRDAARAVADLPVVGGTASASLESASRAGAQLSDAGAAQVAAVQTVALWLAIAVATLPIALVLLRYVPARHRWIRAATAAGRLRSTDASLELLALRAVASRPLENLTRAVPEPSRALAAGDFERLAAVELEALGLRPRADSSSARGSVSG
jgi:hypothetical protein